MAQGSKMAQLLVKSGIFGIILASALICVIATDLPVKETAYLFRTSKISKKVELNIENDLLRRAVLKNIVPKFIHDYASSTKAVQDELLSAITEGVETRKCLWEINYVLSQLQEALTKGQLPETWLLQMIDSWGKFPSGILSGHVSTPGDFLECIQLRSNQSFGTYITGRYCQTVIIPILESVETNSTMKGIETASNLKPRYTPGFDEFMQLLMDTSGIAIAPVLGLCMPASCTNDDAPIIFKNILTLVGNGSLDGFVQHCTDDSPPEFDTSDYIVMILLGVIGLLCLTGTLLDVLIFRKDRDQLGKVKEPESFLANCLLAFSVVTNTEKFLNTHGGSDNLGCLHGLRVLSMAWVLLGHTWVMLWYQQNWNLVDVKLIYKDHWSMMMILNATVSVDTFFVLSATLVSYYMLKELDKQNGKINIPKLYLHRYLRLTPTYAILIGVMATLTRHISDSAAWFVMLEESKNCRKNWWHNLLYINNFIDYPFGPAGATMCLNQTWYIANDMQFFLVAPFIVYALWRWRRIGFGIVTSIMIATITARIVVIDQKEYPPTTIPLLPNNANFEPQFYIKPWFRFGSYLVGLVLGYLLHESKKDPKFLQIPKWFSWTAWGVSTASALAIIFGIYDYYDPVNIDKSIGSFWALVYGGVHRIAWSIVIAWIIFACVKGHGGVVNSFLSWELFMPLGKLTYCIYIVSQHVQIFYHINLLHPMHYGKYQMVYAFFSHLVLNSLLGYGLMILLEAPFITLEKLIMNPRSRAKSQ